MIKKTQRDMAGYLGVTPVTIRNWRRDKPNLYEIVMKGFAFDAMVEKSEENLKELKELQKAFEAERIGLKKRSV